MKSKSIKVIVKRSYQPIEIVEIKNNLDKFRKVVDCLTIEFSSFPQDHDIEMLMDEDGKLLEKAGNFMVPEFRDCIVGTCIFTGSDKDGELAGLTDNQIKKVERYLNDFALQKGESLYLDFQSLMDKSIRKMQKNKEDNLC